MCHQFKILGPCVPNISTIDKLKKNIHFIDHALNKNAVPTGTTRYVTKILSCVAVWFSLDKVSNISTVQKNHKTNRAADKTRMLPPNRNSSMGHLPRIQAAF